MKTNKLIQGVRIPEGSVTGEKLFSCGCLALKENLHADLSA